MRIETEFLMCLQRQRLEEIFCHSSNGVVPQQPTRQPVGPQPAIAPSTWVKLLSLPNPYSSDEALLLCQCSADEWLAWIPDYGELMLDRSHFEPLA